MSKNKEKKEESTWMCVSCYYLNDNKEGDKYCENCNRFNPDFSKEKWSTGQRQ